MLVRVGYTESESIGPVFDEEMSRKTRGIRYQEWAEFIVLWRNSSIHFYEPHVECLQPLLMVHDADSFPEYARHQVAYRLEISASVYSAFKVNEDTAVPLLFCGSYMVFDLCSNLYSSRLESPRYIPPREGRY